MNSNNYLQALLIIQAAEDKLQGTDSLLSITVRNRDNSTIDKIKMLKDYSADMFSRPMMVRIFGTELIEKILKFEL